MREAFRQNFGVVDFFTSEHLRQRFTVPGETLIMQGNVMQGSQDLLGAMHTWLVTGAAGFIGSHLVEALLGMGQRVVAVDNLSTGSLHNLREALAANPTGLGRFRFHRIDVRDLTACRRVCRGVDFVLHQAAIASVPRSLMDPAETHAVNVNGTINILSAAHDAGVRRVVFASSSAIYGELASVPHREELIGEPLSPYALSKRDAEAWGKLFAELYSIEAIGLRYFNVVGSRQSATQPHAAVIPAWTHALLQGDRCIVHGDGSATRDFVPVGDVVCANVLTAVGTLPESEAVFNVGSGRSTSLEALLLMLRDSFTELGLETSPMYAQHVSYPAGNVSHSCADISRITAAFSYRPSFDLRPALLESVRWHESRLRSQGIRTLPEFRGLKRSSSV